MVGPRDGVGRPGAVPRACPVTPQNLDARGATVRGSPGGNNRATVRSAVITVALSRVVVYMALQPDKRPMKAWS
jgi:hypothetical protein